MTHNPAKPPSYAALKRKNERLEVQIQALQEHIKRIAGCDSRTVLENADMRVTIKQAIEVLSGGDA